MKSSKYIGMKFGRLTVLSRVSDASPYKVLCRCDCGNTKEVWPKLLKRGRAKTCGCSHRDVGGRSGTRIYRCWYNMHQRCSNPREKCYKDYGGRGISVCERWSSFEAFERDMGEPPGDRRASTLDRIDNNGNYDPSNCRWATVAQQNSNQRRNVYVESGGERRTIAEWSRITGISKKTLRKRHLRGADIFTPIQRHVRVKKYLLPDGISGVRDAAQRLGVSHVTIYSRIRNGMSLEEAVTRPRMRGPRNRSRPSSQSSELAIRAVEMPVVPEIATLAASEPRRD